MKESLIDIISSNHEDKVLGTFQDNVGRSDHQGVRACIATKVKFPKCQVSRRRVYRNFNPVNFLYMLQAADFDSKVCGENNLDVAARTFRDMFTQILDKTAPIKTVQNRRNYNPNLKESTKEIIKERNRVQGLAKVTGDPGYYMAAKQLATLAKEAVWRELEMHLKGAGTLGSCGQLLGVSWAEGWKRGQPLSWMKWETSPATLKKWQTF